MVLLNGGRPCDEARQPIQPRPVGALPANPAANIMTKINGLSAYCVYTIRHTAELEQAYLRGGRGQAREQSTWVSGRNMLDEARLSGKRLPVVFGCAEGQVITLVYCALLDEIILGRHANEITIYVFSQLKPIEPAQPITRLTLREQRRPLSADFIRPYALCLTPPFVRELLEDAGMGNDSSDSARRL
jgi:hypothetical protein